MDRRDLLCALGAAGTVGLAGCGVLGGSGSEEPEPEPLTGTFGPATGPDSWRRSLGGPATLEPEGALYVLSGRSDEGDAPRPDRSTLTRVSSDGTEAWRVDVEVATGGLRATDGAVYHFRAEAPTDRVPDRVSARDPGTGDHRWTRAVGSHPTFVGTTAEAVFVGETNDDPARLPVRALEAPSGERRWQRETPMPQGGVVSHGLCLVDGYPDRVVALSTDDGTVRWTDRLGTERRPGFISDGYVVGDVLVVRGAEGVTAYSLPDGSRRWDVDGEQRAFAAHGSGPDEPARIYLGGDDGTVAAVDPGTGETQWSDDPGAYADADTVVGIEQAGETVVVRKWRSLYGFDAATGEERWRQVLAPFETLTRPVVVGDTVCLLHAPTAEAAVVKTFDLATGRRQWKQDVGTADRFPETAAFAGRYVVANDGSLYGFDVGGAGAG